MESLTDNQFHTLSQLLGHSVEQLRTTLELLDDGNTLPFITRFRRAETGGLDESQIRQVRDHAQRLRALAERKKTILRAIQTRGELNDELQSRIASADSVKLLDDLYLPFKRKKETRASRARQRGLEPLAEDVLAARVSPAEFEARLHLFLQPDNGLATTKDVLDGLKDLIVENFSERIEVRQKLFAMMESSGILSTSKYVEPTPPAAAADPPKARRASSSPLLSQAADASLSDAQHTTPLPSTEGQPWDAATTPPQPSQLPSELQRPPEIGAPESHHALHDDAPHDDAPHDDALHDEALHDDALHDDSLHDDSLHDDSLHDDSLHDDSLHDDLLHDEAQHDDALYDDALHDDALHDEALHDEALHDEALHDEALHDEALHDDGLTDDAQRDAARQDDGSGGATSVPPVVDPLLGFAPPTPDELERAARPKQPVVAKALSLPAAATTVDQRRQQRREARRKKRDQLEASFKNYFGFSESLASIPPHRVLAINRGERVRVLRVRIKVDVEQLFQGCRDLLIAAGHPQEEMLAACARESISRQLVPSLERDLRRDLTERAEAHALKVFARNIRQLLLQPPVRRRVLAIDPGLRFGCKAAALDEYGNLLGHTTVHAIGDAERVAEGRRRLVELIEAHRLDVIAIGNGTGCRQAETAVASILEADLEGKDLAYVIVNEAGASVYSTSALAAQELPDCDPRLRGAISIGRRLLDPLSELVKIDAANLGVGLYQHDVRLKHLRQSLDDVVQSCVNYVGVDLNSSSPALLRYVSGLNQRTAREIYQYRKVHGPFTSREQLKQVAGVGDASFVQAAGFLKVYGGDNPLDATWIHPENYEHARAILGDLHGSLDELEAEVRRHVLVPPRPPGVKLSTKLPVRHKSLFDAPPVATSGPPAEGGAVPLSDAGVVDSEAGAASAVGPPPVDTPDPVPGVAPAVEAADRHTSPSPALPDPAVASRPLAVTGGSPASPATGWFKRLEQLDKDAIVSRLGISRFLFDDLVSALQRAGRDPREDLPAPLFRRGIMKLEDLVEGMELSATVLNVVDFGAFVDIGLRESGLIHISQLADEYIRDPHDFVSVGDVLRVWVLKVDKSRRRVSLSALPPGSGASSSPARPAGDAAGRRRKDPPRQHGRESSGRSPRRGKGGAGAATARPPKERRPPAPLVPLTEGMKKGTEPMRTFGDLAQFFQAVRSQPSETDESKNQTQKKKGDA